METINQTPAYNKNTFIHCGSRSFDRAGYYGVRALIIIYMTGEIMAWDTEHALKVYGAIVTILIGTELLGGIIGDLVAGNKVTAIIGSVIQALGAFALCIPAEITLYMAIGLIGLGSGLYSPNLLSLFGKNYYRREKQMDSGFTLLYFAINIGAAFGALLVGYLGDLNYTLGFGIAGVLSLMAGGMLMLSTPVKISEDSNNSGRSIPTRVLFILMAALISAIFWALYELGVMDNMSSIRYDIIQGGDSEFFTLSRVYSFMSFSTIFLLMVFGVIWIFVHMNRLLKLALGYVFGALAFALYFLVSGDASGMDLTIVLVSIILLGLAEVFVGPTVLSLVTKYSNPKYLAIIMSLVFLPGRFLIWIVGLFQEHLMGYTGTGLKIGVGLYFLFGIAIFVLSFVLKEKEAVPETNES